MLLWDHVVRPWHCIDGAVRVIRRFSWESSNALVWGIKTALGANVLACGDMQGRLHLWDMALPFTGNKHSAPAPEQPHVTLPPPAESPPAQTLRVVAMDPSARLIVCANDAGLVWLYHCDPP